MMFESTKLTHPVLVTDNNVLNHLCSVWRTLPVLALDTEFIRIDTFFPRLGLIQVCDGSASYLLDPLALTDWESFAALLHSDSIVKVFHSCSEDLVVFNDFFKQLPHPLIDTQKAAAFLDYGYSISYQNLVKKILGIDISKGETRSDWLRRPLSQDQLAYAALDVAYLPEIYTTLHLRLQEKLRYTWLEAECEQMLELSSLDKTETDWDSYYLNLGGAWRLDLQQLGALQRLCSWREHEARRRNKPRSWIAKDADLIILAERLPATINELNTIAELPRAMLQQDGMMLLDIIAQPHTGPELQPELIEQPLTPEQRKILKKCQEAVRLRACVLGIAPELLASKKQLISLLAGYQKTGSISWPHAMGEWRREILESELLEVLR
ncbi:MAG: ribonuclease D [Gammaproteobacteria bacterium]|nr:ribonuclease D [Gammaproteobacteria bacterium]MDP2141120.1 ribonuclease D [Gammaproteobacteria bacterium]MDP2349205.1 ribonuclease D [Gammaproteobacteria bacterium]